MDVILGDFLGLSVLLSPCSVLHLQRYIYVPESPTLL